MKKILTYIVIVFFAGTVISCDDYLDKEYDASLSETQTFNNPDLTRGFLANIYTSLPDGFEGFGDTQYRSSFRDGMTDNCMAWWNVIYFNKVLEDAYTAVDHTLLTPWSRNTSAIRKCNQFLKNAKASVVGNREIAGDDNRLYDRYCAEARFLRAIYHFDLLCWFGDIPIIAEDEEGVPIVFDLANPAAMQMSRTNAAEALKWIAEECDKVKDQLPFRYSNETENWGRVNGAAVYALKSRALLYRASKLNNRSEDVNLWKEAAEAANAFITKNASQSKPYKLYSTGKVNNDYYECFVTNPVYNDEFILCRSVWRTNTIESHMAPCGFGGQLNAVGRTNPTQNFVDCYETTKGLPIDQDPDYDENNPYVNRDPRLEQTVLHHNSIWGDVEQEESRPVDIRYSLGPDYASLHGGTLTGYYCKKFLNNISFKIPTVPAHAWPIFRYGEILLNAAEAYNEAYGPDQAYQFVNQIRARVGMPDYKGMSKEQLRERIRNERRIELSFEDHRFFDERRWMLFEGVTPASEKNLPRYKQIYNLYGVRITGDADDPEYTYGPAESHPLRTFNSPKNYYLPIPDNETKRLPNLGQNPGWEIGTSGSSN
ncbi:hypothetical protein M2137_001196 [Parabacteroides sp. PFB2-10]|uniref:RagB/SusD family nutrient uptake outer membrane protein n=1 Tax=Parabacteroides sp. PFB2-10 TaxID=1742405 RepID=UPI002475B086|nr:RagB/SusD family nutrient uptake outer membrane protein [Parabacteroides sp. PFB2-10]MDH6312425.1 hypothetical protein [Parabacteroides sp. PFB2-10]MDL2245826.1 RagB/SusD family nutrient uptake outer membrane protein [Parabacteroides sp. OttesenSCG-928-J18]